MVRAAATVGQLARQPLLLPIQTARTLDIRSRYCCGSPERTFGPMRSCRPSEHGSTSYDR